MLGEIIEQNKSGRIPTPNTFESLRPSSIFTKEDSGFSCNKKLTPNTIEKSGILFFEINNQRLQLDRYNLDLLRQNLSSYILSCFDLYNQQFSQRLVIDSVLLEAFYKVFSEDYNFDDYFLFYKTKIYNPGSPIHAKVFLFFTHLFNVHWLNEEGYIEGEIAERPFLGESVKPLFGSSNEIYSYALSPIQDFLIKEGFQSPIFLLSNPDPPSSPPSLGVPKAHQQLSSEQIDILYCNIAEDLQNHMHFVRFCSKDKEESIIWATQKCEIKFDNQFIGSLKTLGGKLQKLASSKAFGKIQAFSDENPSYQISPVFFKMLCDIIEDECFDCIEAFYPINNVFDWVLDIIREKEDRRVREVGSLTRDLENRYLNSSYEDLDAFCYFPLSSPPPEAYHRVVFDSFDGLYESMSHHLCEPVYRDLTPREKTVERGQPWKLWFYEASPFYYKKALSDLSITELDSGLFNRAVMTSGEKEETDVVESYMSILFPDTHGKVSVLDNLDNKSFVSKSKEQIIKIINRVINRVQEIKLYLMWVFDLLPVLENKNFVSKKRIKNISDLVQKIQPLWQDSVLDNNSFVSEEQIKNISDLVQKIPPFEKNNLLAKFVISIKDFFKFNVKKSFFNEIPKKKPKPSSLLISRTLSGYLFPDTDIRTLRLFRLENIRKKLLFQKQKNEILSIHIGTGLLTMGKPPFVSKYLAGVSKKEFTRNQRAIENSVYGNVLEMLSDRTELSFTLEPNVLVDNVFRYMLPAEEEFIYLSQFVQRKSFIESESYRDKFVRKHIFPGFYQEGETAYEEFVSLLDILIEKLLDFVETLGDDIISKLPESKDYAEKITIYAPLIFLQYVLFIRLSKGFKIVMSWMIVQRKTYSNSRWAKRLGLSPNYIGYRLLENLETNMDDIAGIGGEFRVVDELIASLSKVSLGLHLKNSIPKGYLLAGPPGTGKTFLVRAIAGESKTPIFLESGLGVVNRILVNSEDDSGARQVQDLFRRARQITPCIVFIDEVDKFGISRIDVMKTDIKAGDFAYDFGQGYRDLGGKRSEEYVDRDLSRNMLQLKSKSGLTGREFKIDRSYGNMVNRLESQYLSGVDSLAILAQFLIELDGQDSRTGVIVIGATNRFKVLDPALTRPGRLERFLFINLPGKRSRIEIMKLYSQNPPIDFFSSTKENKTGETEKSTIQDSVRGNKVFFKPKSQSSVPSNDISYSDIRPFGVTKKGENTDTEFWEYLASLTAGFSAADLARAMNQSSIQAISQKTGQTIETIEFGIESITTYSREKTGITSTKDPFFFTRFAYYQSGKAVLHTLLPQHPDPTVLKLWPRPRNNRHRTTADFLPIYTISRAKLETRLIGFYAGKAGELCALSLNSQTKKQKTTNRIKEKFSPFRNILIKQKQPQENQTPSNQNMIWNSSLGVDDLLVASHLAHSLVEKWHFYSNKVSIRRVNHTRFNEHGFEMAGDEKFSAYSRLRTIELKDKIYPLDLAKNKKDLAQHGGLEQTAIFVPELQREDTMQNEEEKNSLKSISFQIQYQDLPIIPWWEAALTKEMAHYHISYKNWSRIYLHDPKQNERNVEWVAPDKYYDSTYHFKNIWKNSYLLPTLKNLTYSKFLEKRLKKKKEPLKITDSPILRVQNSPFDTLTTKKRSDKSTKIKESGVNQRVTPLASGVGREKRLDYDLTWDDLYKNDRDYIYHALVLTCFNKAFSLLDENRELFDYLADYLLRFEILRRHEIKQIVSDFGCSYPPNKDLTKTTDRTVTESPVMGEELEKKNEKNFSKEEKQKINFIFEKKWGKNSRRPFSRFFSYDKFSLEFFSEIQKK